MAQIVVLGSAAAVSDAEHDNTHLLLVGERNGPVLIDAGSKPLGKIKNLGYDDEKVNDIYLPRFRSEFLCAHRALPIVSFCNAIRSVE